MRTKTSSIRNPHRRARLAGALVLAAVSGCGRRGAEEQRVGAVEPALGDGNPNPAVIPPAARPYGRTYAEWGIAWWEWALSFSFATSPHFDELDGDGNVVKGDADDQPGGPVWFLVGTFGGDAERKLAVPAGKALFFPIHNSLFWSPEDCGFLGLAAPCSKEDLVPATQAHTLSTLPALSASLDGVAITDLGRYRAAADGVITYQVRAGELAADFGYPVGPRYPTYSDGYYLMLHPLTPGAHELHFRSEGFLDVTYHLTVK